jgi:rhodanese-related sulfurtransferase
MVFREAAPDDAFGAAPFFASTILWYHMHGDLPIETDCCAVSAMLASGDQFLLLDCREPDEHAIASIQGSRLIPMSRVAQSLDELAPFRDCLIAVHCHHGGRSLRVAQWLREQGFAQAQSMAGGIDRWALEIDPSVPRY